MKKGVKEKASREEGVKEKNASRGKKRHGLARRRGKK